MARSFVYILKHGRYVAGCSLKVQSHHRFGKLSDIPCSEVIICTFASSPCPALKELTTPLKGFGESRLEALSKIFVLFRWDLLMCYPKMSMTREVGIPRVSVNSWVGIQYVN